MTLELACPGGRAGAATATTKCQDRRHFAPVFCYRGAGSALGVGGAFGAALVAALGVGGTLGAALGAVSASALA